MTEDKDKQEDAGEDCECPEVDCPRHGKCSQCKAYHHGLGQKTHCEKEEGL